MTHWRVILWPGLATLTALAILLTLGTWQLTRKGEKEALLAALELARTAPPLSLDGRALDRLTVRPAGEVAGGEMIAELTRVTIAGRFFADRSVPVRVTLPAAKGATGPSGIGFFWMTPLATEGGAIVFVNRGFVPSGADFRPPAIPTAEGLRTVTGLMRLAEKPRAFVPADNAAKGDWFSRDPEAMAKAVGLGRVADFFIDEERAVGSLTPPVGIDPREMISRIPNNHLQYAGTWYGFAAVLLVIFVVFARGRLRAARVSA
ncbi:MAG: SURF1 family protein [Beijerinckiaceae bacterium]